MTTLCQFEPTGEPRTWRCQDCGIIHKTRHDQPPLRICPARRQANMFPSDGADQPCCNNSGDSLPSLSRQTWNYLANTAAWLRGGARTVSDEDFNRRKSICESCPAGMLRSTDRGPRCGACGCWIDRKAARLVRIAESDCPLGHWPIISDEAPTNDNGI